MSLGTSLVVQWLRLCFNCRAHRFDPWLGNYDPTYHAWCGQKIKIKK